MQHQTQDRAPQATTSSDATGYLGRRWALYSSLVLTAANLGCDVSQVNVGETRNVNATSGSIARLQLNADSFIQAGTNVTITAATRVLLSLGEARIMLGDFDVVKEQPVARWQGVPLEAKLTSEQRQDIISQAKDSTDCGVWRLTGYVEKQTNGVPIFVAQTIVPVFYFGPPKARNPEGFIDKK